MRKLNNLKINFKIRQSKVKKFLFNKRIKIPYHCLLI